MIVTGTSFPIVVCATQCRFLGCRIPTPQKLKALWQVNSAMSLLLVRNVLLYSTSPRAQSSRVHMDARACAAQCCVIRRDQVVGADLLLSSLLLRFLSFFSGIYFLVPVEWCHCPLQCRENSLVRIARFSKVLNSAGIWGGTFGVPN